MRRASIPACLLALLLLSVPATAAAAPGWRVVSFDHEISSADRSALDAAGALDVQPWSRRAYVAWMDDRAAAALRGRARVRLVRTREKVIGAPGGRVHVVRRGRAGRESVLLSVRDVLSLARRRSVLSVGPAPTGFHLEDERTSQLVAGNAPDNAPQPGYAEWLRGIGLDGTGVRISVVDTGIDRNHPDVADRVKEFVDYQPPSAQTGEDAEGHGTHVTGIVAGTGAALAGQAKDTSGFLYGLGVAPGTEIIGQNGISLVAPRTRLMLPQLAYDASRLGAVAWNASWHTGEGTGIGYVENSRVLDALVRDADGTRPGNQPLAMVFSAGNEGSGETTITSPKEAKNIITVASSGSGRGAGPLNADAAAISLFSSRGPALDGRILPTVTAPGENVISARSRPAGGLCNEPQQDGFSPLHSSCSGTSMASPHVAGAVAILTQWWRGFNGGANPSPAMIKALLVAFAQDIGEADVPNGNEGWGRVDLKTTVGAPAGSRHYVDQTDVLGDPGEARTLRVEAVDPSKPLGATLVWSDAPGTPKAADAENAGPALVNDLDLSLTGTGGTFWGNAWADGAPVAGGAPDRLNNLERAQVPAPGGVYELRIAAAALPGDGVPGSGDSTDQDYALVLSNARVLPAPPAAAPAPAAAPVKPKAKPRKKAKCPKGKVRRGSKCVKKPKPKPKPKRRKR